jgi:adenosylcobinamide kinase/adenosylcobinamide-phosphate guanylyltransferase
VSSASSGITLVLGGARSGKTRRAQELAEATGLPLGYVATCPPYDDLEMMARIDKHRAERSPHFATIEGRYDLADIARQHAGHCLVLDCLTLWLYVMQERLGAGGGPQVLSDLKAGLTESRSQVRWIIVSSEIGLGVVPMDGATRAFRDLAGSAHQLVGGLADKVELMVAGLPLTVK